ncbi:MAG: helix-turn-helix domain-containing protein [Bacillota bacterium]
MPEERAVLFGLRLAAARHASGLTQEDLATALGVARATVAHWEIGRRVPDALTLADIAAALGANTDALLGMEVRHD